MREDRDCSPAFPVIFEHSDATSEQHGLSKRELFAVMLAQGLVSRGPVTEGWASDCASSADELLCALAEPKAPEPLPPHLTYDGWTTPSEEHTAIKRIAQQPDFDKLPEWLRNFINFAVFQIQNADDGIPF